MSRIADVLGIPPSGVWSLLAIAIFLVLPTVRRLVRLRDRPSAKTRKRMRRVGTWWILFALLLVVLAVGRAAVIFVMLAISLLVLREALRLANSRDLFPWFVAFSVALYLWAWFDRSSLFLRWMPALMLALVAVEVARRLGARRAGRRGRPRRDGLAFAPLLAVVGPSYTVAVASLPGPDVVPDTGFGWLVLLLLLTAIHDSAQAWWGRVFGSRPLAPELSPNKTWEGLWGGLVTTATAAALLGPTLTPFGRAVPGGLPADVPAWAPALGLGLVVGLAGTGGDLAASALKRRAGVDDSGDLVPGHGGVLDRFDSLAATAPTFFFLSHLLWFSA